MKSRLVEAEPRAKAPVAVKHWAACPTMLVCQTVARKPR